MTELQNALACAARVFALLDAGDQTPEAPGAAVLQPDGRVSLEDVCFRYLPDRPLIEHFSLERQARPACGHRGPHRLRQRPPSSTC